VSAFGGRGAEPRLGCVTDNSPQRQRILEAAVAILADRGEAALTVRAVAVASDFSTTGIYTWFGGKEGLLEAIYRDGFARFRAFVAEADVTPDPRERLRLSGERYWNWALANRTHYLLMFAGVPSRFTPSAEAVAEADLSFADLVQRTAAYTRDDAAHHIWATLHGYTMLQLSGASGEQNDAFARLQSGIERTLAQLRPISPGR
jgi:AcrR family transcriptional regulator